MDGFSITVRGEQEVIDHLRQFPSALEKLLAQVGAIYESEVKKQLSLAGTAAKAMNVSLGRRKRVRYGPFGSRTRTGWLDKNPTDHLRVGSGRLRSSITHALVVNQGQYEVRVGTNVVYARIHEFGAPAGKWKAWGRITKTAFPARPYMKPVAEDRAIQARVAGMIGTRLVAVVQGGS